MSMPQFPHADTILDREKALDAVIASIALEETALSHILNAEGEKIQFAIKNVTEKGTDQSVQQLLAINNSVASVLEQVKQMQLILKAKLDVAEKNLPEKIIIEKPVVEKIIEKIIIEKPIKEKIIEKVIVPIKEKVLKCPPCVEEEFLCPRDCFCGCPEDHFVEPFESCVSVFSAVTDYGWFSENTLRLKEESSCKNGIKLCRKNLATKILLPSGRKFKIVPILDLINKRNSPVCVSMELFCGDELVHSKKFSCDGEKYHVSFSDSLIWDTSFKGRENVLTIRLLSPETLKISRGELSITEV